MSNKTVQEYIDEKPYWVDGTQAPFAPMTNMQWKIWWLATAGKFFEGWVIFMTGVAIPLIVEEFNLYDNTFARGAIGAAPLFGILVGASVLGNLSDHFGRKRLFIIEMIIFSIFLVLLAFSPNYIFLLIFLFGLGTALGCVYPTAHMVISESIPSSNRGRLVLGAFAFQAIGALVGTAVALFILCLSLEIGAWRWMYASAIIPAILVTLGRFFITDSPHWLVVHGHKKKAGHVLLKLLNRSPKYPSKVHFTDMKDEVIKHSKLGGDKGYSALFKKKALRATILSSIPWFLQDLGTYGIGIFTPVILASTVGEKSKHVAHNILGLIHNDMIAAKGAAFIDIFLIIGIVVAMLFSDKIGRIKLQVFGFIGNAVGLFLAALSLNFDGSVKTFLIFGGFMLFSFMNNLGPNSQTYLIAGEVFPTRVRGKGAGFAASFAKIGAVLTAFFFPILLKDIGTQHLLMILIGTSIVGAVITWIFRIETRGVNLESIDY